MTRKQLREREAELALTIACPTCRMSPGEACLVMSRCGVRAPHPHQTRIRKAVLATAHPFETERTTMITCPCGYVAAAAIAPTSPAWHRAHREHHLRTYPRCDDSTRDALDELIASAERREKLADVGILRGPDPEGIRARRAQRREALTASPRRGARRKAVQA